MKFSILFSLILHLSILHAQKEIVTDAPVGKATVFLSGVQLFHSQNVQLAKGSNEIRIRGLAAGIDQNSVQASGWGEFTILDVQYNLFYPEPVAQDRLPDEIQKKILMLDDSILVLNFDLKNIGYQKENISYQKQILLSNKLLRGEGVSDSLPLLIQAIEYYQDKLQQLSANLIKLEIKENDLNTKKVLMQNRLAELHNYWSQQNLNYQFNPIPEIIVSVVAEQAASAELEVNYITYNAGWYATYDLRATDVSKPVELTYKANIWQNTGVNWKDVKITCSTGNPSLGNNPPAIGTWYIGYYNHYYERDYSDAVPGAVQEDAAEKSMEISAYLNQSNPAGLSSNYTAQSQTIANTEFVVNLKYSIPSDGKGHIVALKTATLASDYNYLAVPKVDLSAFLIARITGWEDLSLIPGNANIYFSSTYVGKTMINGNELSDTLEVSLGRDKTVELKRTVLTDKTNEKFLNSNITATRAFEISVRNPKSIAIELIVKDHIPVSQVDEVKVELNGKGGATLEPLTGILTWRMKVNSKETKRVQFDFSVTYPKDMPISQL